MRYSDGPTVEVSVRIEAPAAAVWGLITDIGLPARFSSEFQGAEWVEADGPAVGARFVGHNHHDALGSWETTSYVTRCEPERAFEWAVTDPESPSASWWFTIEPVSDTTVVLRQGVRLGPARSGLSYAIDAMPDKEERIVARRLEEHARNMQATIDGVKGLAEASASGRPAPSGGDQ